MDATPWQCHNRERAVGRDIVRRGRNLCHIHVCRHAPAVTASSAVCASTVTAPVCWRRALDQGLVRPVRVLEADRPTVAFGNVWAECKNTKNESNGGVVIDCHYGQVAVHRSCAESSGRAILQK